jgi:formate/nitrite transporter FocA (FNT family)
VVFFFGGHGGDYFGVAGYAVELVFGCCFGFGAVYVVVGG